MKYITWFTLLELLLVIVIIGVLSATMLSNVRSPQSIAKIRAANIQMRDFNTALVMANVSNFKTLIAITNTGCTDCPCIAQWDLRKLTYDHACRQNWRDVIARVEVAAWLITWSLGDLETDPRGSPYQLNENEWESGQPVCTSDTFFSVGPDGIRWSIDDISYDPRPVFCPNAY